MTSLGNIELIKKDIFNSGVAFELNKASDVDDIIDFENGWQAEIKIGIQYLVVRGVLAELTYEEVYTVSYNYAQKFLDLLSVCKITKINLKNHTSSFLIWWRNQDGQNLQVRDISRVGATVQFTVHDENGRDMSSPISSSYHPSYRYFRLSKESEDLFESFRNMYLAFENLLNDFTPKKNGEGEGVWLKRGLEELEQLNSIRISQLFNRYQPPQNSEQRSESFPDLIYRELYKDVRCKIFHFKKEALCLIPGKLEDQEIVEWALYELTKIFICMAIKKKKVNPKGSFSSNDGALSKMASLVIPDEMNLLFSQEDTEKFKLPLSIDAITKFPDVIASALINAPSPNFPTRILEQTYTMPNLQSWYHVNFFDAILLIDGVDLLEFRYEFSAKDVN